nr:MAG TPA: hypothetical protein [Bacteriophage sp.]
MKKIFYIIKYKIPFYNLYNNYYYIIYLYVNCIYISLII